MKIAVEGCAHGELDTIYETIEFVEKQQGFKIDLLLCCGDFQSVRNKSDLTCMAVPPNYRKLNTFYKYYSGEKKAPVLTIFIGGNHEASNYLAELPYGGWVCPNIYYMGYASILQVGGLRIAGLSGIYKGNDYLKGHFEVVPFNEATKRSIYHVRNLEVFRFRQICGPIDIFISHDWPRNVYKFGDTAKLLKRKPFFKEDIDTGKLGSRPAEELLEKIQPAYWFAAHLHVKFAALVPHSQDENGPPKYTKFLALDKCLPRRKFLQILDIPHDDKQPLELQYDPEWLCVLRSTNHLFSVAKGNRYMPGPGSSQRWDFRVREGEMSELEAIFQGDFKVPLNFEQTDPPHDPSAPSPKNDSGPRCANRNPQTISFCKKLGLTDPLTLLLAAGGDARSPPVSFIAENEANITQTINPDEISIDDEVEDDDDEEDDESELESFSVFRTATFGSPATGSVSATATASEDEGNSASQDSDEPQISPIAGPCFPPRPSVSPRWEPPAYRSPSSDPAKRQQGESDSANGNISSPSSEGSAKKFKRRNLAIYASPEDEGES